MLNKELFKETMDKLLSIHGKEIDRIPVDMLRLWYEELKELKDEDFIEATERAKFAPRLSLYYIITNLPDYDRDTDKTINDYCDRRYKNKGEIVYGF